MYQKSPFGSPERGWICQLSENVKTSPEFTQPPPPRSGVVGPELFLLAILLAVWHLLYFTATQGHNMLGDLLYDSKVVQYFSIS